MQNRNSFRNPGFMKSHHSLCKQFMGLVLVGLTALPLPAQDVRDSLALEEIIVTSTRRESALQDIPIAVSAFDANEMERRQSFNVVDVANNIPNLVANNNIGQSTATTVFLRGVGTTESIVTVDTAMGFYLDDIYIARQGVNNFSLYDIERVEVLRGPQGTLYGRNTSAGAMKVTTTKPQEDFSAGGQVSYGEYDRWNLKGSFNAPLVEDKLLLRLNGIVQQGDGYTNNTTLGRKVNDRDVWGLRGALRYIATPDLEFLLTVDHSESEDAGLYAYDVSGITRPPGGDIFTVISGTDTTNIGEQEGVHLTIDWTISDTMQFQSLTAYRNTFQQWNLDLTDQVVPIFTLYTINDSDQFNQEFKLTGDLLENRLHYVGGFFYFDEDSTSFIGDTFDRAPVSFGRDYKVSTESWAVYADFTFDLTDKLSLIFGGRYTEDDKSLDIVATSFGTPGFENNGVPAWDNATLEMLGIATNLNFEEFIPRLGVEYRFTDDILGYLTYTEGYKSGGWGARTRFPAEVTPFDPEFVNSFALGLKTMLFNGQVRLNSEAFFYDYDNLFNTGTGDMGNFIVATNDAEVYGLEIEGTARITDAFDLFGYIATLHGEYQNVDPDASFVGGDLQRLPEFSTKFGGTYTWDLRAGSIRLTADYSYQEDHFTNLQNTELARSGDISLVNAVLGYDTDDGRFGIALSCRNCADDEYVVQSLDFAGFGFITLYPGEPRTWLVTVSAKTN